MSDRVVAYIASRREQMAQRIRQARTQHGWTQDQTAHFLGCSRIKINRVERGRAELGVAELELLAQEFELPVSFFLQPALGE
jgi:transcriptional regulator with XRE-family HTH domain